MAGTLRGSQITSSEGLCFFCKSSSQNRKGIHLCVCGLFFTLTGYVVHELLMAIKTFVRFSLIKLQMEQQ